MERAAAAPRIVRRDNGHELKTQVDYLWRPSNVEPLHRVLPESSSLHEGVETLDRVMFAVSNTELKPAMLLYGLDRKPAEKSSVNQRYVALLPDSYDSKSQSYNVVRMVRTFMIPPGFAEEPTEHYFATTAEGETVAKDSAAFLLKRSVDLETPFGPIIQERTEDRENPTRAYITRVATLIALREGALPQVKLLEKMGSDYSSLAWNLRVLDERGLIAYEAVDTQVKGQHMYERVDLSKMPETAGVLAKNIFKYFEHNESGNQYTISEAIGGRNVHYVGKGLKELAQAGVVKQTKWKWGESQSEAEITPLGRKFVDEVVIPLLAAYSGDERSQSMLRSIRAEMERNPGIATRALDQYKQQRVLTPEVQTQREIVALIKEEGPLRRRDILVQIGKHAHPQIIELVASGRLRTVRDGNASFYTLPDSKEQPTKSEEIILVDFSRPPDILPSQESRKTQEYREDLERVDFWQRVQSGLTKIKPDRHTAGDYFKKYDPDREDWADHWDVGIFSGHVRALRTLGIEKPWEFIRTYKPEDSSGELVEAISATQDLMNKVIPLESGPRKFYKYLDRLEKGEFWTELADDVQSVSAGTKFEGFLLRFDPEAEGKMVPRFHYGKYYNFRAMTRKHTDNDLAYLLLTFRPPKETPIELLLTIREAQAKIRGHLKIRANMPDDDFSDFPELQSIMATKIGEKGQEEIPQRGTFSIRSARFVEALQSAGLRTTATSLVARHLAGKYHPEITENLISQFNQKNEPFLVGSSSGSRPTLESVKYLLSVDQTVISALQEWDQESDTVLRKFIDGVVTRAIREDLYRHFEGRDFRSTTPDDILKGLDQSRNVLKSIVSQNKHEYLDEKLSDVYWELVHALEQTGHLKDFFKHPLSLEQIRVINDIASGEGHDLLAHPPGEGKTAMALAGAWEYFRRSGIKDGVVLYLGPVGAVDNLQRNVPDRLNQQITNQFQIANWADAVSVADKYDVLSEAVKNIDGPLVLPISYSMVEPEFIEHFNNLMINLHSKRTFVPVADEVHHNLGYDTVYANLGSNQNHLIPISGLSSEDTVVAVEKPHSFLPVDYLLRATPKNILITGTPLNTGVSQLLHLASWMESKPDNGKIRYPSFDQVKGWIDDPLTLSALFQEHMHRSSHLALPNVQRVVLECDFEELPLEVKEDFKHSLSTEKKDHQLQQLGLEFKTVFPFVLPMLNKSQDAPVVISVPYVDEKKITGAGSTKGIADYLRTLGYYGTSNLDSTLTKFSVNEVLNQFREDDGTDIVVISPALGESRDLHSTIRPTNLVISLGASTVRSYEQAVRRVVRVGNQAETVHVVTPVPKNFPTKYSLLQRRHDVLQERLETATAILDPVSFIQPERSVTADALEEFLPEYFGIVSPQKREYFNLPDVPIDTNSIPEEVDKWNQESIIPYLNELKTEILFLRDYQKPVVQQGRSAADVQAELAERGERIYSARAKVARFIGLETQFILQELSTLNPTCDVHIDSIQTDVTSALRRFCGAARKDEFLSKTVFEAASIDAAANQVPIFKAREISDRSLLIALRQKTDLSLHALAWEVLNERYGGPRGFIKNAFKGYPAQVVEDLEQEIWTQLIGTSHIPYGTLHSIIRQIGEQQIGQILGGKKSVKSSNFADVSTIRGVPIEESARVHAIDDNF